jgi:putative ABC transport system substrate-binding protein
MARHNFSRLAGVIVLWLFWTAPPIGAVEPAPAVAVIYPELQDPYREVLSSVIDGIQEQSKLPVKLLPLAENYNRAQLNASISQGHFSTIIALGRTGLAAAQPWRNEIPIVAGALLLNPEKNEQGLSGISLAADPEILLARLAQLAPSVKRVHAIYSPESSDWLIQLARSAAGKRNFRFMAYKSEDIKSSALIYRDILNKSRPGEDAIWLLPDPVAVDDKVILPLLLKGAWDDSVLIFSSNPAHVKRGTLFALFPDNESMGRSLAKMAEDYATHDRENTNNGIVPLRDLQAAINVRTAEHIGLFISDAERRDFALIFPTP